jgi:hypothetical protein
MHEEGWYTDPYGLHEARWMSDGQATALVRDGNTEATEDVPPGPFSRPPERIAAEGTDGSTTSDILKANETSGKREPNYQDAAEESIDSSW